MAAHNLAVVSQSRSSFEVRVRDLAVLGVAHGGWPAHRAADPVERSLGGFTNDQRYHDRGGARAHLLTAERAQ